MGEGKLQLVKKHSKNLPYLHWGKWIHSGSKNEEDDFSPCTRYLALLAPPPPSPFSRAKSPKSTVSIYKSFLVWYLGGAAGPVNAAERNHGSSAAAVSLGPCPPPLPSQPTGVFGSRHMRAALRWNPPGSLFKRTSWQTSPDTGPQGSKGSLPQEPVSHPLLLQLSSGGSGKGRGRWRVEIQIPFVRSAMTLAFTSLRRNSFSLAMLWVHDCAGRKTKKASAKLDEEEEQTPKIGAFFQTSHQNHLRVDVVGFNVSQLFDTFTRMKPWSASAGHSRQPRLEIFRNIVVYLF